jgi:hypothetical protein
MITIINKKTERGTFNRVPVLFLYDRLLWRILIFRQLLFGHFNKPFGHGSADISAHIAVLPGCSRSELLRIQINNILAQNLRIEIFDINGERVFTSQESSGIADAFEMEVPENMAPGFYIVKVSDGRVSYTEPLYIME